MKRREAIQNIALISAGIVLLPACDFETWPVFDKIPLTKSQQKIMTWLTETILPKGEVPIVTPELTPHFVLTMINDCAKPEDLEKYVAGLQAFEKMVTATKPYPLEEKPELASQWLAKTAAADNTPENIQHFLSTTRSLSIQHFTTSEYFLKNNLGFEFIPGRFNGCVPV